MIVKINGEPCTRVGEQRAEPLADWSDRCGFYGPIDKTRDMILETDFYHHEGAPSMKDLHKVEAICNDDPFCWLDSANRLLMESTEVTKTVYRFITHRMAIVRDGVEHNFLPWDLEALVRAVTICFVG